MKKKQRRNITKQRLTKIDKLNRKI